MKSRFTAVVILLASLVSAMQARVITDMVGRKVAVPDKIERLFAPSPYGAFTMYALAPDLMTGVITPFSDKDKKYLPKALWNLPALGGGPQQQNPEALAKSHPQLLIVWKNDNGPETERSTQQLERMGIPYVYVVANGMQGYPAAIRFLGQLVGRQKRAEEMALQMTRILHDAQVVSNKIPANRRARVYYAEGVDGLSTECNDSIHTEVLQLAGDINVQRCHSSSHMGFEKVSLEQVMMASPDVILAQEKLFYDKVYRDPAWRQVKAVREHHVYYVPHTPLNWFDRPPSFMRFLGLEWVMTKAYPGMYQVDMTRETKKFFHTFLGVTLSDQDARALLQ